MDATVRPLRIPPEMAIYAEKHDIFHLVQTLLRNLMVDKPEDPIQYLINLLKRDSVDVPRIILLGPPASGKRTIAKKLCEHTQAIHLTFSGILKDDSDLTRTAQYQDKKTEDPQRRLEPVDSATPFKTRLCSTGLGFGSHSQDARRGTMSTRSRHHPRSCCDAGSSGCRSD